MLRALLAGVVLMMIAGTADAQLLKRNRVQESCPNGVCQSPQFAPQFAPQMFIVPDAPAVAASPVAAGGILEFHRLRARLAKDVERRAALPETHADHIDAVSAAKATALIGKLGDGHLIDLLVKYGPAIAKLIAAILAMITGL